MSVLEKRAVNIVEEQLTREQARREVVKLAWPAVVEQFLIQIFGMIDMMMVGAIGPAAIAAIGLTNQPMLLAMAAFMALNVGTTAVIARAIGAGDLREANEAARQALVTITLLGILVTVLLYTFTPQLVKFMGAEEDSFDYAVSYMRVVALGLIPQTISMAVTAMLRGAGDTRTPLRFNIIANVINVFGNAVLINGLLGFPRWGVYGAGLATSISRLAGCILSLYAISRGGAALKVSLRGKFRFKPRLIQRIVRVGLPAMLEQVVLRFGVITYTRIVSGLGTMIYAAHQIGMNIVGLSFTPGQGFSMAATSLVGRSLGSRRPDRAERYGWETRYVGMHVAGAMGLIFFFGGGMIARLYTDDPTVVNMAATCLKIIAIVQLAQSSQFILAGALRGAGDTKWPLISTMMGVVGVRVALATLFVRVLNMGLNGAWYAMAIDQFCRSLFIYFRYRSGRWKELRV